MQQLQLPNQTPERKQYTHIIPHASISKTHSRRTIFLTVRAGPRQHLFSPFPHRLFHTRPASPSSSSLPRHNPGIRTGGRKRYRPVSTVLLSLLYEHSSSMRVWEVDEEGGVCGGGGGGGWRQRKRWRRSGPACRDVIGCHGNGGGLIGCRLPCG